jgi:DNA-directed RNA polymerase sigma subunit (sigma70/sigma32)
MKTHGMSQTRFYRIWGAIQQRCCNEKNDNFDVYGNRGIRMCDRWLYSFDNFKEDMYESYQEHAKLFGETQTTIDRKDCNGDYCKENCQWATKYEQIQNTRKHLYLEKIRKEKSKTNPSISVGLYMNRKEKGYKEDEIAQTIPYVSRKELSQKKLIEENLQILQKVSERRRRILEHRFGLKDGRIKTLTEVGNDLGLSRERARQIVNKGFEEFSLNLMLNL